MSRRWASLVGGRVNHCGNRDDNMTPNKQLEQVRRIPVDQSPYGQVFHMDDAEIDTILTVLFATHDTVTHKDVAFAFELTLTSKRVTTLLRRLVREGRLVVLGCGAKTHYRPAPATSGDKKDCT